MATDCSEGLTPAYPTEVFDGNYQQQDPQYPITGNETIAECRDYNIHSVEIIAIEQDLRGFFDTFSRETMADAAYRVLELINAAGGDGTAPLGTPSDGSYASGLVPLATTTQINDAIDEMNDVLAAIAPAPAGDLDGVSLDLVGATAFSAKLPSGLSANWGTYTPGDPVTSLIVSGAYQLRTPDLASRFTLGLQPDPAGILTHVLNGTDASQYDCAGGVGSSGAVELFDVDDYNSIWLKGNARLNIAQAEGKTTHRLKHELAGETSESTLYYDDVHPAPSFSTPVSHTVILEELKYLSGIAYYTSNSRFGVSYVAASGIFRKAYHPSQVSTIEIPGAATVAVNPSTPPDVDDPFSVSGQSVQLTIGNVIDTSPEILVTLRKPDGQTITDADALARQINTYGTASTATSDLFVDEARRLVLNTNTAWTPADPLVDGNAQVGNGFLIHGADGDYAGFSGDQEYQRKISKTAASSGTLTLSGISHSDVAPYGTGTINVLLQLDTDDVFFDLGRVVGDDAGDGSTRSLALGSKVSGSGSDIEFSFLTYSTGDNSNEYRVIIIFRSTGETITALAGS
jgi:hypothetical protein